MMPWDVSTRWNSTFDMLEFAIQYRVAIDAMTAVRGFDLRKYELAPAEWNTAMELRDVLKVSNLSLLFLFVHIIQFCPDFQGCDIVFLTWHPQPGHRHPSHRSHQQGPDYIVITIIQVLPCHSRCPYYW
jgi:hypothetical protein